MFLVGFYCRLPIKKDSTMKAKATIIIMPIQVGIVASFVIIVPVALYAEPQPVVLTELQPPPPSITPTLDAVCNSDKTINPIANIIATVTIERINPCRLPICPFFNSFMFYCLLPMKNESTMKARLTIIMMPIQVGTVASFAMIVPVEFDATVSAPVETPPVFAAVCNSDKTINPIAKTIATVTILRINPCRLPI